MLMRNSDMICMRKRLVGGLIVAPATSIPWISLGSSLFFPLCVSKEGSAVCKQSAWLHYIQEIALLPKSLKSLYSIYAGA